MSNQEWLPDGGLALASGGILLPVCITVTELTLFGQELNEIGGRTMIHIPLFGYLFTFMVAMKRDALIEHMKNHFILTMTNFKAGPLQISRLTGERFRDILCDPVLKNNVM